MTPEASNAINSAAKKVLIEYRSKGNSLSYREVLDKHAKSICMLIPRKHQPWMWLNAVCQRMK